MVELIWEEIKDVTDLKSDASWIGEGVRVSLIRAKVLGGWLVKHGKRHNAMSMLGGVTFVPDPKHKWK